MGGDKNIFEILVEYPDKRRVKFYAIGNYGIVNERFCKNYYESVDKTSLHIINLAIKQLEHGQGEFNKDFTVISYREIGTVLIDYFDVMDKIHSEGQTNSLHI